MYMHLFFAHHSASFSIHTPILSIWATPCYFQAIVSCCYKRTIYAPSLPPMVNHNVDSHAGQAWRPFARVCVYMCVCECVHALLHINACLWTSKKNRHAKKLLSLTAKCPHPTTSGKKDLQRWTSEQTSSQSCQLSYIIICSSVCVKWYFQNMTYGR